MVEQPIGITDDDRTAIMRVATDYIESWLDGDQERMRRCLHPQLAKRSVGVDPLSSGWPLDSIDAADMVRATGEGHGRKYQHGHEVTILDAYGEIATVRIASVPYIDYLHIARFGKDWLIVNALWQRRAEHVPGR
jgi:Putative lumazine-binding